MQRPLRGSRDPASKVRQNGTIVAEMGAGAGVMDRCTKMVWAVLGSIRHSGGNRGRGGDILYRWGNPQVYRAGRASDQTLFAPHDAAWIERGLVGAGDIMIFNNGQGRPEGQYSSVDVIAPPMDKRGQYVFGPDSAYRPENAGWI